MKANKTGWILLWKRKVGKEWTEGICCYRTRGEARISAGKLNSTHPLHKWKVVKKP